MIPFKISSRQRNIKKEKRETETKREREVKAKIERRKGKEKDLKLTSFFLCYNFDLNCSIQDIKIRSITNKHG